MDTNWASEHLQVIRTLMERTALYRRALAPTMLLTGAIGLFAAAAGWLGRVELPRSFVFYWLVVGLATVAADLIMVRRQALKESEPFWSPPTRRVIQAVLPPLVAGLLLTMAVCFGMRSERLEQSMTIFAVSVATYVWLPSIWIVFYGCALHAAGFFMPRGIKLFGWIVVLGGASLFWLVFKQAPTYRTGHALMGLFFGALHLAYGSYLHFTERAPKAL